MPSISIQAGSAAITAASNQGVATVSSADLLNIYPGAWAWLAKTDGSGTPKKVKVIQILSTTTFLVAYLLMMQMSMVMDRRQALFILLKTYQHLILHLRFIGGLNQFQSIQHSARETKLKTSSV